MSLGQSEPRADLAGKRAIAFFCIADMKEIGVQLQVLQNLQLEVSESVRSGQGVAGNRGYLGDVMVGLRQLGRDDTN